MNKRLISFKKYDLEFAVFVCGAVVMALELVGSRVLAPYVGASLAVWTSLIGVILASLSLGYYCGGKQADRQASLKNFSAIMFLAGVCIAATAILKSAILVLLTATFSDIRVSALIGTVVLFAPASFLLGQISPYAIKLKIQDVAHAGATAGTLYALSTIGSIAGTFVAGFYLIPSFGNTNLLYVLALALLVTSSVVYRTGVSWKQGIFSFLIILCMGATVYAQSSLRKQGIIDVDTQYQHVQIYTAKNEPDQRPVRLLKTDPFGAQSGQYLDSDELLFEYTKFYHLSGHVRPDLERALMIGGGAYSYPKAFLNKFPAARIDVVELDPRLTQLAQMYFDLQEHPRLRIIHEDGRMFLNRLQNSYDAVMVDAFHSLTPPFQLTTREAAQNVYDHLTDKGVLLMNIISAVEGEDTKFLRAEYATYKSIFPQVEIFSVDSYADTQEAQNIMLLAYKSFEPIAWESKDAEINGQLNRRWTRPVEIGVPILTDDHAPVDQYLISVYQ